MAIQFGKGISVVSGFDLGAEKSLDSRLVVSTYAELQSHIDGGRAYEGMTVYVEERRETYRLTRVTNEDNTTSLVWEEFGYNQAKFDASVAGIESDIDALQTNVGQAAVGDQPSTGLHKLIDDEIARAIAAEKANKDKINIINGSEDTTGSIAKALKDSKLYTDTKASELDTKITTNKNSITALETRCGTIESTVSSNKTASENEDSRLAGLIANNTTAITNEVTRAMAAEKANKDKIDIINGTESIDGSIAKSLKDAKDYTDNKVAGLVNSAPEALDTLKELADALNNDASFATNMTTELAKKATNDALNAEITRAKAAEKANTDKITELKNELDTHEHTLSEINTGYRQAVDENQRPVVDSEGNPVMETVTLERILTNMQTTTASNKTELENKINTNTSNIQANANAISTNKTTLEAEDRRLAGLIKTNADDIDALETRATSLETRTDALEAAMPRITILSQEAYDILVNAGTVDENTFYLIKD